MKLTEMKNRKNVIKLTCIIAFVAFSQQLLRAQSSYQLTEGEILYSGTAKLEKCDEVVFSFVLSATRDTVKKFSIEMNGIYVIERNGAVSKITSKSTYDAVAEVKDGVLDYTYPYRDENWRITIKQGLGNDTVAGEIKCVYVVNSSPMNKQIEDLGTAPIEFKKVQN